MKPRLSHTKSLSDSVFSSLWGTIHEVHPTTFLRFLIDRVEVEKTLTNPFSFHGGHRSIFEKEVEMERKIYNKVCSNVYNRTKGTGISEAIIESKRIPTCDMCVKI